VDASVCRVLSFDSPVDHSEWHMDSIAGSDERKHTTVFDGVSNNIFRTEPTSALGIGLGVPPPVDFGEFLLSDLCDYSSV